MRKMLPEEKRRVAGAIRRTVAQMTDFGVSYHNLVSAAKNS